VCAVPAAAAVVCVRAADGRQREEDLHLARRCCTHVQACEHLLRSVCLIWHTRGGTEDGIPAAAAAVAAWKQALRISVRCEDVRCCSRQQSSDVARCDDCLRSAAFSAGFGDRLPRWRFGLGTRKFLSSRVSIQGEPELANEALGGWEALNCGDACSCTRSAALKSLGPAVPAPRFSERNAACDAVKQQE